MGAQSRRSNGEAQIARLEQPSTTAITVETLVSLVATRH
jgi:hypothetical protein